MIISALKNVVLLVLALSLSALVWAVAQVEQNPETRDVISGVPVELRNLPAGVEVSSVDQTMVGVLVQAPQNVWTRLDVRSFRAWVDLTGLDAGTHDLDVHITSLERWARIMRTTPMRLSVQLERIQQKIVPVAVSVLDNAPAGYSMGPAVVTPTQVMVIGRQSVVDQVTEAVALVRVEGARSSVTRPAKPVLRDGRGSEVKDKLTVSPDTVQVGVPIVQLLSYKTVAMRAVITGTVAAGYHITNIVVEPQTISLGGDPRVLEVIPYIDTGPVDVSGARAELTKPARFTVPADTAVDRRPEVFVKVTVEPIPGGEIIRRPVTWKNLGQGLRIASPLTPTVDIELAGPLADLAKLAPAEITVTVDLTGTVAGTMEKALVVAGVPKTLRVVRIVPERLVIVIEKSTPALPSTRRNLLRIIG